MSHIASVELEVKDLSALREACARLGLEFAEGQTSFKKHGTSGDCDHAIRVPGGKVSGHAKSAYEIGVVSREGHPPYDLQWDSYMGGHGLTSIVGENCSRLKVQYALAVAKRAAMAKGFTINELMRADGSMCLTCTRA